MSNSFAFKFKELDLPGSACKALAGAPQLPRKSRDSAQTVLGFARSWGGVFHKLRIWEQPGVICPAAGESLHGLRPLPQPAATRAWGPERGGSSGRRPTAGPRAGASVREGPPTWAPGASRPGAPALSPASSEPPTSPWLGSRRRQALAGRGARWAVPASPLRPRSAPAPPSARPLAFVTTRFPRSFPRMPQFRLRAWNLEFLRLLSQTTPKTSSSPRSFLIFLVFKDIPYSSSQ